MIARYRLVAEPHKTVLPPTPRYQKYKRSHIRHVRVKDPWPRQAKPTNVVATCLRGWRLSAPSPKSWGCRDIAFGPPDLRMDVPFQLGQEVESVRLCFKKRGILLSESANQVPAERLHQLFGRQSEKASTTAPCSSRPVRRLYKLTQRPAHITNQAIESTKTRAAAQG